MVSYKVIIEKKEDKTYLLSESTFEALMFCILCCSPDISSIEYNDNLYDIDDNKASLLGLTQEEVNNIKYTFNDSSEYFTRHQIENSVKIFHKCVLHKYDDDMVAHHIGLITIILSNINNDSIICVDNFENMTFINNRGINHDKRGTKDNMKLPYQKQHTICFPCKMSDIFECYHRVKSHKFDYNYELFAGLKIEQNNNENITLGLTFDHGS